MSARPLARAAHVVFVIALLGCKQSVILAHVETFGEGGAAATTSTTGQGTGGAPPTPAERATEICAARDGCPNDEDCLEENTCAFAITRPDLRDNFGRCRALACGPLDECWTAATLGVAPPPSFVPFRDACHETIDRCDGAPKYGATDWCDYAFFTDAVYTAMLPCTTLACGDIVACLRTAAFAAAPTCTSL